MTIAINYNDGGTFQQHQLQVMQYSEQIIEEIIAKRVNNDLVGQAREAAINTLRGRFRPNLDELNAILTRLSAGVNQVMDNFKQADAAGSSALS